LIYYVARAVGDSMTAREQLHAYIAQLEQRLRWSTALRGFAILTGGALVATLVLVAIANALAFSQGSVTATRFALILILAIAAAAGLALPLYRLTRRRAIGTAEAAFPQFQQRLTTSPNATVKIPLSSFWQTIRSASPNPPSPRSWSPTAAFGSRSPRASAHSSSCFG
jgi:hypothetical protein